MADKLVIAELTPEVVFNKLVDSGLSKSEAAIFVGEWIIGEFGKGSRSFNYVQAFDSEKPDCGPAFIRSFSHKDWVDGEDTVQAGETAGEEGFNKRFHAIENDLDALGRDTAGAFACLKQMRKELSNLLGEIRNEFNRLNRSLDKQRGQTGPPVSSNSGVVGGGTLLGSINFNDKPMTLWQTTQGMMLLPSVTKVNLAATGEFRIQRASEFARYRVSNTNLNGHPLFGNPAGFTVADFLTVFGSDKSPSGKFVSDLVLILPPQKKCLTIDELLVELTDYEAAALRTTAGALEELSSQFRIEESQKFESVSIENFFPIPAEVRTRLSEDIPTVGRLAALSPRRMLELLRSKGVQDVRVEDCAGWIAAAMTIQRLN